MVHHLALVGAIVHHFEEGLALEALLHEASIGDLAFLKLFDYGLVQTCFHCVSNYSISEFGVLAYVRASEYQSNFI